LDDLIPCDPRTSEAYDRILCIFGSLERVFFQEGTEAYIYYTYLARRWMRGTPLEQMIEAKLKYKNQIDLSDPVAINKGIRALLKDLEHTLHYKYVKYARAYEQVLAAVLRERGLGDLVSSIAPLHMYIEYGASDLLLITLMSIGMTRTTAILVRKGVARSWPSTLSRAEGIQRLRDAKSLRSTLPSLCWNELEELIGVRQ
jgi:hypothetical protein